ncbi:MAG: hypothetical protein IPL12_15005 [Bacteroidetes bacterium]|nr:hypothetical protein [Bacteroidota bacterium]
MLKLRHSIYYNNSYVPHMDVKWMRVPGMPTSFKFTPLVTTADKRQELSENEAWQEIKEGDDTKMDEI